MGQRIQFSVTLPPPRPWAQFTHTNLSPPHTGSSLTSVSRPTRCKFSKPAARSWMQEERGP